MKWSNGMINVAINGASGRMGREIIEIIKANPQKYNLSFAKVKDISSIPEYDGYVTDFLSNVHTDVLIDFSNPSSSIESLNWCIWHKLPIVIGTSGFSSAEINKIKVAAQEIPVLFSANMSLSVNVLYKITELVAKKLQHYEVEIAESHHRYKKDAPSGTALSLGEIIARAREQNFAEVARFDRTGNHNEVRKAEEIGFSVIRGGDIVGRHTVSFITDGEELNFTSMINNRSSFAAGSLLAALFVSKSEPGFYTMEDALNLHNA
jgi:4-hydroxy-tetrahydrodipicolinate reductase